MSKRFLLRALSLVTLLSITGLYGCQNGSTITPQEEARFKNPPKDMPKEAVEFMNKHSGAPQGAQAPAK